MKRLITLSLALLMVLSLFPLPMTARAAETFGYFFGQLATEDARSIYRALNTMRDRLNTGTYTMDLVKEDFLEEKAYDRSALAADFSSAKDAFMMDNAALFYVDFDKLSINVSQSGSNSSVTLGVGRDTTYYRTGFDRSNVKSAVSAFDAKVNEIVKTANSKDTQAQKVRAAYDAVVKATSYALETQAKEGNADYVRTPYGALVKGESVCEGYSRALKAVLDKMGMENVLVYGAFADDKGTPQPHMWNYVKMDDNRWYLLDTTMEDGDSSTDDEYFLKSVIDNEVLKDYQPDGVISLSQSSFEFAYPDLSGAAYQALTTDMFTIVEDGHISYKGMGVAKAKAKENVEVLGSHDGKTWHYIWNMWVDMLENAGDAYTPITAGFDADAYFTNYTEYAYVATTTIEAPAEKVGNSYEASKAFYTYTGGMANVKDIAKVGEIKEYEGQPPVIVEKTPNTSQLRPGMTYNVKIVYSEKLQKANASNPVGLNWVIPVNGAKVENIQWDGDRTVTFDLTTSSDYGYLTYYYFDLENLVGVGNGKPSTICFNVVRINKFACPKVPGDINAVHANTPALVADTNLAENNWGDISFASDRLALVASTVLPEETEAMEDAIEKVNGGKPVLASQTFDISLTLCSSQVSYISGNKVKVFVPFPEGYSADSEATFKAYHFKADGTPEEIDCVVTKNGIIMMCEKFSPFAVVAVEKEPVAERAVITFTGSRGVFDKELVSLKPGEEKTVTVTADSGYRIDSLKLNGVSLSTDKLRMVNQQISIPLTYDQLKDSGNTLEATFVLKEISTEVPSDKADVTVSNSSGAVLTAPEGGWAKGENTFIVSAEKNVVVAITNDNGASYTRLVPAGGETANTYTANITGDNTVISVILAGDADNNGIVDASDVAAVKSACLKNTTPNALGRLVYDLNGDGKINILDLVTLRASLK